MSLTTNAAVYATLAAGLKAASITQLLPAASVLPHPELTVNSAAPVPITVMAIFDP